MTTPGSKGSVPAGKRDNTGEAQGNHHTKRQRAEDDGVAQKGEQPQPHQVAAGMSCRKGSGTFRKVIKLFLSHGVTATVGSRRKRAGKVS